MDLSSFTEGDYIRTVDGLFFAVKGGRHSDRLVIAILRYVPDPSGDRKWNDVKYRRVYDNESTTRFLEEHFPFYLNHIGWLGLRLQSVPKNRIAEVYKPVEHLQRILAHPKTLLEKNIAEFVSILSEESKVSPAFFGVSGSVLIGLERDESDIDLNIYGEDEGRRVYDALKRIRSTSEAVSPYDAESIEPVLVSRWGDTGLDLEKLRGVECRKLLHGLFRGVDYFIRLLVDEDESESTPMNDVVVSATVADASHSIYTPCVYKVTDVSIEKGSEDHVITELKSYRGKFTEQANTGDRVRARGTMEKVIKDGCTYYRLILGKKGDYLVPV
ncbi:hypothetical protein E2P71_03295 [Candidatus Bathyarchaeota archaeon]|nr:hypothetical protein E2P71_03295 [Candidatus Bathyarchaeota archaeon]